MNVNHVYLHVLLVIKEGEAVLHVFKLLSKDFYSKMNAILNVQARYLLILIILAMNVIVVVKLVVVAFFIVQAVNRH